MSPAFRHWLVAGAVLWAFAGAAESPAPGTYVLKGGSGTLVLTELMRGGHFTLDVVGGNAHSCQLQGPWTAARGKADNCSVSLERTVDGVDVRSLDDDACRAFCGARAWFEGHYLKPLPECTAARVTSTRARFLSAYRRKQFAVAVALLQPVVQRCADVLNTFDEMDVRNDLAVAQHHAGNDQGCLDTLAPMKDLAAQPEDEVGQGEPAYTEILQRIAKATRTNLALCGASR